MEAPAVAPSLESSTPASRRRRLLAVYVDYLLVCIPIALVLWVVSGAFPWIRKLELPIKILLFLMVEVLLLKLVKWSPGQKALGIETLSPSWAPIEPEAPKGAPVVDPWLLRNERWWTILPGVLLVLDGAKLLVRWTEWARTMPFFGVLLDGGSAVAFQIALGVLETGTGLGVLLLRRWAAWAGTAYAVVVLTSFATSAAVLPEHVERETRSRRAAMGREARPEEIRFAQSFVPTATIATSVGMLAWMGVIALRIRAARRDR
jgi:hypothetical protein